MGESRTSSGAVRTGVGSDRPDRVQGAHGRDGAASTRLGLNFAPQKFPDSIERTLPDLPREAVSLTSGSSPPRALRRPQSPPFGDRNYIPSPPIPKEQCPAGSRIGHRKRRSRHLSPTGEIQAHPLSSRFPGVIIGTGHARYWIMSAGQPINGELEARQARNCRCNAWEMRRSSSG